MNKRVKILTTQNGDWSAMYIDGQLTDQGVTAGKLDTIQSGLWLAQKHGFKECDVQFSTLSDEDDLDCRMNVGLDARDISELEGEY